MRHESNNSGISGMNAVDLVNSITSRQLSPVDVVTAAIKSIDAHCGLNSFMAICAERALEEAKAAEAAIMSGEQVGPLCGIPFSAKDLIDTENVITTYGSASFKGHIPATDAVSVSRTRAAGAILIGKTTTPEFGHKAFTEGPYFGRTLNPWHPKFTCGGSSGGAAASVAAGITPIALGTDGGGSVRIPAACCGIAGFKATLGVIPNLQAPDLFGANSYVGPMARNIGDLRLLFEVLQGPDRRDPYGQQIALQSSIRAASGPVRIGWLLSCGCNVDPEIESITLQAMTVATDLGYIVEPIELDFVSMERHFLVLLQSLLRTRLLKCRHNSPDSLDSTLISTIDAASNTSATELHEAQFARSRCFARVQQVLEKFDLFASPTLSAPPLPVGLDPLGEIEIDGRNSGTIRGAWYPYTFPLNLTGHPALSIPCGISKSGLPVGLQLVGHWFQDRFVLDIAEQLERAISFSERPSTVPQYPA